MGLQLSRQVFCLFTLAHVTLSLVKGTTILCSNCQWNAVDQFFFMQHFALVALLILASGGMLGEFSPILNIIPSMKNIGAWPKGVISS